MDIYNFGASGTVANNATKGSSFCLTSTVGYIPTRFSFQRRNAATAPSWMIVMFTQGSTSTTFLPLVGVSSTANITSTAWFNFSFDLGPTLAAYPSLANSAGGMCLAIHAMFNPGTSVFGPTTGSSVYSNILGDWFIDNVIIAGK